MRLMINHWKRLGGPAVVALALAAIPATAQAATTIYASPTGSGTACTSAAPCSLETALATPITSNVSGDTVVAEPGTYGSAASPLNNVSPDSAQIAVTFEGQPGAPRPTMYFNGPEALFNAGSTMQDLTIHDVVSNPGVRPYGAVTLYAGATVERVLAYGADNGCSVFGGSNGAVIRDSACIGEAGYGLQADGTTAGTGSTSGVSVTLRNDTVLARSLDALNVGSGATGAEGTSVTAVNTIAHKLSTSSARYDVKAFAVSGDGAVTVSLDHCDFATQLATGGVNTATVSSTNQVTAAPLFVSTATAGAEDLHEASGSPTIGAGVNDPANGAEDLDGLPRELGGQTDIGAYQAGGVAPTATTGGADGITTTGATLHGTVTPNSIPTTVRFEYGTSTTYGSVTADQTLSGSGATDVSATLTGLAPGTVYHYRVVAINPLTQSAPGGEVVGNDATFETTSSSTSGGGGTGGGGGGTGGSGGGGTGGSGGGGTAAGLAASVGHVKLVKHGLRVTLRCPARSKAPCVGRVVISVRVKSGSNHKHKVTLGSARYSIAPGHTKSITIAVSKAGLRLLSQLHGRAFATVFRKGSAHGSTVAVRVR